MNISCEFPWAIKNINIHMKVAIIKYNAGNIKSVLLALKRLGIDGDLTDNPDEILNADRVIFPWSRRSEICHEIS